MILTGDANLGCTRSRGEVWSVPEAGLRVTQPGPALDDVQRILERLAGVRPHGLRLVLQLRDSARAASRGTARGAWLHQRIAPHPADGARV